jgi:hypothetical protein
MGVIRLGTALLLFVALGALSTSNQIGKFGLVLVNNSTDTYDSFSLSYTGEQWRRGRAVLLLLAPIPALSGILPGARRVGGCRFCWAE